MARKSRKQIAVEEPVIESVSSEVFSTAIYARLSVENSGKSEKVDVIANQIEICKSYIAERPYLNLIDTYVDNGRTGTVFDRPEFNRLMNDIRTGRIKCLVVRDLSRFGRDYIEAGTYLERVFPQIGLRFIAIKENYDNFDTDGSGESLIIPLQNMINTLYSKDISRKVSTALKAQMESGEFKKRNLPYGYRWDEEHSNMVFDEETAPIVQKIFQWKIEGLSLPAIADRLDAMNAPNPEFQKYQVGVRTGNATAKKIWNKSSLTTILDNPHYVGDTVLGRTLNASYKGVKNQHIDREEWIVFPNTHEAIISREDFQKVQELRDAAARTRIEKMERTEKIRATLINLFEDKIVCADCGRKLEGSDPANAVDEDCRRWWSAGSDQPGEWLCVDLGRDCDVRAVQVNMADEALAVDFPADSYGDDRKTRHIETSPQISHYTVETSLDGKVWTLREDVAFECSNGYYEYADGIRARYIRVAGGELPYGQTLRVSGLRAAISGSFAISSRA